MLDANSNPVSVGDVDNWASDLGLSHPVLADAAVSEGGYILTGYPTYVVIDREMVIQNADMWPWSDSEVTSIF